MDISVKKELDKMLLLMERMDSHYTLDEALEMEDKIENKRDTYTDLNQFLSDVNLGHSFVGLAYVQGYEARKIYPTNASDPRQANAIRGEFGKMDKSSRVWGKMNNLINDPEFTNPSGRAYAGNRSMKTPHFSGIVKFTNYVFNWGDTSSLSDFYNKYGQRVKDTRIAGGFGKDPSSYPQGDWHTNDMYGGVGDMPVRPPRDINGYHQSLDAKNSLYGFSDSSKNPIMSTRADGSQYQKKAFRFGLKDIKKQWAKYFLVDLNGEIDPVGNSLGPVMGKIPADQWTDLRKKIVPQMQQDEIDFINNIAQVESDRNLAEKTWLTDHIAYIVACEYDPRTSTRRYVRWINPDIEIDKFPVNQSELKTIVSDEIAETETAVRYSKSVKPAAE